MPTPSVTQDISLYKGHRGHPVTLTPHAERIRSGTLFLLLLMISICSKQAFGSLAVTTCLNDGLLRLEIEHLIIRIRDEKGNRLHLRSSYKLDMIKFYLRRFIPTNDM